MHADVFGQRHRPVPGELAGIFDQLPRVSTFVLGPIGVVEVAPAVVDVIDDEPRDGSDVLYHGQRVSFEWQSRQARSRTAAVRDGTVMRAKTVRLESVGGFVRAGRMN